MTTKKRLKITLATISPAVLLISLSLIVSGCMFANDDGARADMHKSDNNRAIEIARFDSSERIAQADADARKFEAGQQTQQTLLTQLGTSERVILQGQQILALRQMGTDRLYAVLGFFGFMAVLVGGGWLFVYLRNNPRPAAYAALRPLPAPQSAPALPERAQLPRMRKPVPYSTFVNDPRFRDAGWVPSGDPSVGVQVNDKGVAVATCKLLEG